MDARRGFSPTARRSRDLAISALAASLALGQCGCQLLAPPGESHVAAHSPTVIPAHPASAPSDAEPDPIEHWARQLAARDDLRARLAHQTADSIPPHAADPLPDAPHSSDEQADASRSAPPLVATSQPVETPALSPPRVVEVAALTGSVQTAPPARMPQIGLNEPEQAVVLPATLRDWLAQAPPTDANTSFREQLDLRVLWAIAGDAEKARAPLTLASQEQADIAARFIDALLAARQSNGGAPAAEIAALLEPLRELHSSLSRAADLSIPTLEVCRAVRGFGQYDPIDPPRFIAGRENELVVYAEIRDYVSEKRSDGFYHAQFRLGVSVLSSAGDVVVELKADDLSDRCRNRRSDCFVSPLLRLPRTLSPGEYVVKVTIGDRIGRKVAERSTRIRVVDR